LKSAHKSGRIPVKVWLDALEARGRNAARLFAFVGMLGLAAFASMTIVDALMRWLLNSPIDGVADVGPLVIAIVIASFFPLALAERRHVSIEFLGHFVGTGIRAWLDAIAAFVTLVFLILLVWQIVMYTVDLNAVGQTTWVVQIPVAPWWSIVCFFLLMCIPVQLIVALAQCWRARNVTNSKQASRAVSKDASRTDGGP
jgi:TRAP-type transport system small permease protein